MSESSPGRERDTHEDAPEPHPNESLSELRDENSSTSGAVIWPESSRTGSGAVSESTEVLPSPRTRAWLNLFQSKGWLIDGKIVLPANILVYIYFPPATTDINTIESISLQRVTEVTEHFIIHRVNSHEEEYYLWEDIQCLRIKTKKPSRFSM
ncbi:MAG: hypothetical protein CVV27_13325 [Candidatus Melainabacteria bacterium HGW-Melainabacteria-1]|nr:MAG: hypothetical protein CVV27_13325 [Candidatus Melainabacteria bacterium HGW-Melainabacteria-1]